MEWWQITFMCLCGIGGLLIGSAITFIVLLYQVSKGVLR